MTQTNSQKMAQAAFKELAKAPVDRDFVSFARGFPTLAHSSGLTQAIAFAKAKGKKCHQQYLAILTAVLNAGGFGPFGAQTPIEQAACSCDASEYMRISRGAFIAADWIKRYAEALAPEPNGDREGRP